MTKLTGVGFVLSVGHNSPEGVAHGHSYDVTVWYRFGSDARALQRHADVVKQRLCHTFLPDELQFAENLAEHIAGELPGCIAVDCNRPLERIYARWKAQTLSGEVMDEQMIEPKECPLCSDKDEFNPSVSTSYKYAHPGTASTDLVEAGHFIECDKCACCGPIKPTEEEAIAAWNTRAAHSVIAGKVVELTEALKDARQAIDTLDEDAFGLVMHHHTGNPLYPVRDELLAKIDAALAPYPERRSE